MVEEIRALIVAALPDADVEVQTGGGGHYALRVRSAAFEGKNRVAQQRMVLSAIKSLMDGDMAPVHAIDTLITEKK